MKKRSANFNFILGIFLLAGIVLTVITLQKTQLFKQFASFNCVITNDNVAVPCRPLLGATANNYPPPYAAADDKKSQILGHEARIGRQLDIVHNYHPVGDNQLSATDLYFATQPHTFLLTSWKPTAIWSQATGNNNAITAGIDKMALSIKAIEPKKIFLTLNHEPENDTTGGGTCSSYKGSAGTTSDYKAMWRYIRGEFDRLQVKNVIWFIDYMNYPPWNNCIVEALYPGDDMVDWIMFNGYGANDANWVTNVSRLYNLFSTSKLHNYTSKQWGIVEWGIRPATVTQKLSYFQQVKEALDNNTFPKLKAYIVFDQNDQGSSTGTNIKIAYDDNGLYHQELQDKYNELAQDPLFSDSSSSSTQPTDTPAIAQKTTQWVNNQSVESDMSGWTGRYGKEALINVERSTEAAHTGSFSIKVLGLPGANNYTPGFNDDPRWVTNTAAGMTYSQSAWVKPGYVGQKITMRLREWQANSLITDRFVTLTASTTSWQLLTQTLTATGNGNQLSFAVFADNLTSGRYFYADDFSLTSN